MDSLASWAPSFRLVAGLALALPAASADAKAPPGRYLVDAAQGTVLDKATGLTWQRDGAVSGSKTWSEGAAYCKALPLSGGGWRLPDVVELRGILDRQQHLAPLIDPTAFPGTPPALFWTSTPDNGSPNYMRYVHFESGQIYGQPPGYSGRVRCVR